MKEMTIIITQLIINKLSKTDRRYNYILKAVK